MSVRSLGAPLRPCISVRYLVIILMILTVLTAPLVSSTPRRGKTKSADASADPSVPESARRHPAAATATATIPQQTQTQQHQARVQAAAHLQRSKAQEAHSQHTPPTPAASTAATLAANNDDDDTDNTVSLQHIESIEVNGQTISLDALKTMISSVQQVVRIAQVEQEQAQHAVGNIQHDQQLYAEIQRAVKDLQNDLSDEDQSVKNGLSADEDVGSAEVDFSGLLSERDKEEVMATELVDTALKILSDDDAADSDVDMALSLFDKAAALGSPVAHTELGKAYMFGDGRPRNMSLAEHHFLTAAEEGSAAAQHMLAFIYTFRLVPTQNSSLSSVDDENELSDTAARALLFDYFAALNGDIGAKLAMGYRHMFGVNVIKLCPTANDFYREVAEEVMNVLTDSTNSVIVIDRSRLSDDSARVNDVSDSAEVMQYYQHSADSGNVDAQVAMGQLHYYGQRGVAYDPNMAAKYFTQAAQAGDSTAMVNLGQMHMQGIGVTPNNKTAFELFTAAAKLGNSAAQTSLGQLYLQGIGTPIDYAAALKCFELAAAQGSSEAHFQLGLMYMTGLGVERQLPKAFQEFHFASLQGHTRALFNVAQMQTFGIGTLKSCSVGLNLMKVVAERGPWATVLTEAHQAFLDGEYDQSWLLYALAGMEGYETGLSNAAWMIDHGLVHMPSWGEGDEGLMMARQIAYELYEYSAAQNNVESMRRMGDFVWYGWAKPTSHNKTQTRDAAPSAPATDSAEATTTTPASNAELERQQHTLAAKQYERAGEHGDAESWFNLGYQYQYGIGVNRDLHLSKRYYDRAVLTDPKAWLPTKLALIALSFDQFIFDHFSAEDVTSSTTSAAADTSTSTSASGGVGIGRSDGTFAVLSDLFAVPLVGSGFWVWYEWIENVALVILTSALAALVYIRAQRM